MIGRDKRRRKGRMTLKDLALVGFAEERSMGEVEEGSDNLFICG